MTDPWNGQFIDFPQDNAYWRVDWLGPFHREISTPTEPKIVVLLSPLIYENFKKHGLTYINVVDHKKQQIIYINAGYLPYIFIGAIFRNGFRIDEEKFRQYKIERQTLEIVVGRTAHLLHANYRLQDGNNTEFLIPRHMHRLGKMGLQTKFVGIDHKRTQYKYLIPTIEVGRHFYFNSTKLTRQLLWGGLKGNNTIYNPARTSLTKEGAGLLCLRQEIDDDDGWVVSQFAFNKKAFNRASQIHSSMVKCNVTGQPLCPDILPPIDGTYTLEMHGKWILSAGDWRFLVFWIQSSHYPFPVADLTGIRDNSGINNGTYDMSRKVYKREADTRFSRLKKASQPELVTQDEPDKDTAGVHALLNNSRFEWIADKPYKKVPRSNHTHRADPQRSIVMQDEVDTVSTGEGMYRQTGIAALNLQNMQANDSSNHRSRTKTPPADLDRFERVLMHLSVYGISHRFITPVSLDHEDNKYCLFPLLPNIAHWSSIGRKQARKLLLAEVTFHNRVYYLFESEAKNGKGHTTLLLHNELFSTLPEEILSEIIHLTAKNKGVWEKERISELCYRRFNHSWKKPVDFAVTLRNEMKAHISYSTKKCAHYGLPSISLGKGPS